MRTAPDVFCWGTDADATRAVRTLTGLAYRLFPQRVKSEPYVTAAQHFARVLHALQVLSALGTKVLVGDPQYSAAKDTGLDWDVLLSADKKPGSGPASSKPTAWRQKVQRAVARAKSRFAGQPTSKALHFAALTLQISALGPLATKIEAALRKAYPGVRDVLLDAVCAQLLTLAGKPENGSLADAKINALDLNDAAIHGAAMDTYVPVAELVHYKTFAGPLATLCDTSRQDVVNLLQDVKKTRGADVSAAVGAAMQAAGLPDKDRPQHLELLVLRPDLETVSAVLGSLRMFIDPEDVMVSLELAI